MCEHKILRVPDFLSAHTSGHPFSATFRLSKSMNSVIIAFDIVDIIFFALSLLISVVLIVVIILHLKKNRRKVTMILICNSYIAIALVDCMMLIMAIYNFIGHLDSSRNFNDVWCRVRTYFIFIGYCGFYYSFLLQASFRLFRVVFYKQKFLQSRPFFFLAIALQWILSSILPMTNLLPGDYEYLLTEFNCWFSFENVRGLLLALLVVYSIPIVSILLMYVHLLRFIRRANPVKRRQEGNKRDILVLKRIVILLLFTVAVGLPTAIILFIYIISKNVISYAYEIQGFGLSVAMLASAICFALISPELKQIFCCCQTQVHPGFQSRNQQTMTMAAIEI